MAKMITIVFSTLGSLAVVSQLIGLIGPGWVVFYAENEINDLKNQTVTFYDGEGLYSVGLWFSIIPKDGNITALIGDIDLSVPRVCALMSVSCQIIGLVLFVAYIQAQKSPSAYTTGLFSGFLLFTACLCLVVAMLLALHTDIGDVETMEFYGRQPWAIYVNAMGAFLDFVLSLLVFKMACFGHNNERPDKYSVLREEL